MPVLVSEWTIDPAAARPPSQDPSNPGIYHARVAPDSDCQPTRSGSPRYPSDPAAKNPMSEAAVIGLDLHVSNVYVTQCFVNLSRKERKFIKI